MWRCSNKKNFAVSSEMDKEDKDQGLEKRKYFGLKRAT